MTDEEFPFGLRCADCDVLIEPGDHYSQRLEGFVDDVPLTVLTCVPCGYQSDAEAVQEALDADDGTRRSLDEVKCDLGLDESDDGQVDD
jgi:hypothetical protein